MSQPARKTAQESSARIANCIRKREIIFVSAEGNLSTEKESQASQRGNGTARRPSLRLPVCLRQASRTAAAPIGSKDRAEQSARRACRSLAAHHGSAP